MRFRTVAAFLCWWPLVQNTVSVSNRVPHFAVKRQSRLAALAQLGSITNSSLLVEAGDMDFLKAPVTLSEDDRSFDELIVLILRGRERYTVRRQGRLTIAYPLDPHQPLNRILTVQLRHFQFNGRSVSALDPYLAFKIREATGCHPQGYGYAGPPMDAGIPAFDISTATFTDVVVDAANASVPTMWVLLPNSGESGCISDPGSMWEVGMYGDAQFQWPFRESIGPQVVR
jgi:hypothetical protein